MKYRIALLVGLIAVILLGCFLAVYSRIPKHKGDVVWLQRDTLNWSSSGRWLAVTVSREVYLFRAVEPYRPSVRKGGGIQVLFAPKEEGLAYAANDWGTAPRGVLVYENQFEPFLRVRDFQNPYSPVRLAVSPDGAFLAGAAYGEESHYVYIWDTNTRKFVHRLEPFIDSVASLTFSSDGRFLAAGRWNSPDVLVWDVLTGKLTCTLSGHTESAYSVSFQPDSFVLATGSDDRSIRLWNVEDCRLLHTLMGHKRWISDVAFSPDGTVLASSSADGLVLLWNPLDGRLLHQLQADTDWIYDIEFSPDGDRLAAGSSSDAVFIWETESGKLSQEIRGACCGIYELAWNPNGRILAVASMDGMPAGNVLLWNFDKDGWDIRLPGFQPLH